MGLALISQFDIIGAIILLHLLGDPSAVTGFVITLGINSVNGQRVIITM